MSNKLYVRLKPHNPRRGHVLRRYSFRGLRFNEGRWFKVPSALAQELAVVHQKHGDPDSPLAFDVATEKQANAIEEAERRKLEEEQRRVRSAEVVGARDIRDSDIRDSGAMTTRDLPKNAKDKPLGVDMSNTKAELMDVAESLGLEVSGTMTKAEIFSALQELND